MKISEAPPLANGRSAREESSPAGEYIRRLGLWEARAKRLEPYERRMGAVRLLLAALALATIWASVFGRLFSAFWVLLAIAAFAAAVLGHTALRRRYARARRAVALYRNGLARLEDRWAGRGVTGVRFASDTHVYAADLDLFGQGGLFELLSAARTRMGEETLAQWLLAPARIDEIRKRQACITDLRARTDLAEDLALLGEEHKVAAQPQALVAWAESAHALPQPWVRWAVWALPALCIMSAMVWGLFGLLWPLLLVLLLEIVVLALLGRPISAVLSGTEVALEDLDIVSGLLSRVEREPFQAPALRAMIATVSSHEQSASRSFQQLHTIANLAESRSNLVVRWLLSVPLLFPLYAALRAERWRVRHGAVVRRWIEAVGQIEALGSLARYSYEHPADPLPELLEGSPCFRAAGIGHPLMPAERCVRNDVELAGDTHILLVSGSNMSGKSTLLRTVGLNAVLAMAGAPVRAHSLSLTVLQVGASIRINDSLQAGISRFYAEITRLRKLYELACREPPMLFLLDELLQGTNSHDRRIGAEAILSAYRECGAIGLATTHDLALTTLQAPDQRAPRNMHFDDHIEGGVISFDYKLRDGVVTTSNALELMRSIGLKV